MEMKLLAFSGVDVEPLFLPNKQENIPIMQPSTLKSIFVILYRYTRIIIFYLRSVKIKKNFKIFCHKIVLLYVYII